MNNLWVFGCSQVNGKYNVQSDNERWPEILANKLNLKIKNMGESGAGNDLILKNVLLNYNNIKENDVVLVLLTYKDRFLFGNKNLSPHNIEDEQFYLELSDTDFFELNLVKNVLSLHYISSNRKNFFLSFVDGNWFNILKKFNMSLPMEKIIVLPKLSVINSFSIDKNNKHLTATGHNQMAEFFSKKLHFFN